jgi:hypothetical protein
MISRLTTASVQGGVVAVALAGLFAASALAQNQANRVAGIKAVGDRIEVTVSTNDPMTFNSQIPPTLVLGDVESHISEATAAKNSSERTFHFDRRDFNKAKSGAKVTLQFGQGEGRRQVEIGTLNKAMLQQ